MIEVRCRFSDREVVYWTGPIHDPRALECFVKTYRHRGFTVEVFDDHGHFDIAELCFEIAAERPQLASSGVLQFGPRPGSKQYRVDYAQLPSAGHDTIPSRPGKRRKGNYAPVVGGFPLLDLSPSLLVARHPDSRPQPPVAVTESLPRRESWLDRLFAWVLGTPRGSALGQ